LTDFVYLSLFILLSEGSDKVAGKTLRAQLHPLEFVLGLNSWIPVFRHQGSQIYE